MKNSLLQLLIFFLNFLCVNQNDYKISIDKRTFTIMINNYIKINILINSKFKMLEMLQDLKYRKL